MTIRKSMFDEILVNTYRAKDHDKNELVISSTKAIDIIKKEIEDQIKDITDRIRQ